MAKKTVISKKSAPNKTAPMKKSTNKISGRWSTGAKATKKSEPRKSAKVRRPKGPIWQWSAVETASAIRSGAISAVEVVEAHLARMRAVNPKLNAVVVDLSEEALAAAQAADKQRAKGKELGLLHGVPITIKENVDYEGRPNPNGVKAQMNIIAPFPGGAQSEESGRYRHWPHQYAGVLLPRLHRQSAAWIDAEPVGPRHHLRRLVGRRWGRGGRRHRRYRARQ